MSSDNVERSEQIKDLGCFIETSCQRLTGVLSVLGWTQESLSESRSMLTCTFNNGHRVPRENFKEHLEKCEWKAEGYSADDLPLSELCLSTNAWSAVNFEISHCCPRNVINCDGIALAGNLGDRLIPRTSDRLVATFSSSERKAFYDHAIANTIKPVIGDDIADINRPAQKNTNDPKTSLLELLVQERNLKRRRAKHRGVHTNKKSHIEIMREVIDQQMEMYQEYLADTSIKEEPKSSDEPSTRLMDSYSNEDKKYSNNWPERGFGTDDHKHRSRDRTIPSCSSSPRNYTSSDRVQKRSRLESESRNGEKDKEKRNYKYKRDRSGERKRCEDGRSRHRKRDEDLWDRDESRQSRDKYDRKKRRRSRDRSDKSLTRSRRHENSDNKYQKHRRY